jgi:hypothetical protein
MRLSGIKIKVISSEDLYLTFRPYLYLDTDIMDGISELKAMGLMLYNHQPLVGEIIVYEGNEYIVDKVIHNYDTLSIDIYISPFTSD